MRTNIAKACKIPLSDVSVKATTEEGLGFTGTGEGISSQAITLLTEVRPDACLDFSDMRFAEIKHTKPALSDTAADTLR